MVCFCRQCEGHRVTERVGYYATYYRCWDCGHKWKLITLQQEAATR